MLQLSTALLANAAGGVQKRYVTSNAALSGLTQQLKKIVADMDDGGEAAECVESFPYLCISKYVMVARLSSPGRLYTTCYIFGVRRIESLANGVA